MGVNLGISRLFFCFPGLGTGLALDFAADSSVQAEDQL